MHIDPKDLSFANLVIRAEVKKLHARGVIRRDDAEDFASELMVQLLAVWDQYDPARATREAFINQVVNTRLVSILRERCAKKRTASVEPLGGRDIARDVRVPDSSDLLKQVELQLDIEEVIRRLTPKQRELCARVRDLFRDAGLDKYI